MKRGLFIGIIGFIFLASFIFLIGGANAGCVGGDNQVILRLSSNTNAHGEVWNGAGSYPVEICYNEIFSGTGAGDRTCKNIPSESDFNIVLRLASNTNAHAEAKGSGTPGYSDLCYDNIVCSLEGSTNTRGECSNGKFPVVRLSKNTNAHLAIGADANYNFVVCCNTPSGAIGCNPECNPGETCENGICTPAPNHCSNEIRDADEADIDCGGNDCPLCSLPASCTDGVLNGDETGVDCGGSCPACSMPSHCSNGVQDSDETGVDCGGNDCLGCPLPPHCSNGVQDSDETGVDCGGNDCLGCSGGVQRAYWANTNGVEYASNANVYLWDTVRLVATQIPSGEGIAFEVWDNDCVIGNPPCAGDDKIVTIGAFSSSWVGEVGYYDWTINQNSYSLGGGGSGSEGDSLELYFIARYVSGDTKQSNILNVLDRIVPPSYGVCGDYTEEIPCNEDVNNYAENSEDPRYSLLKCDESVVDCHCVWEGGASSRCILNATGTGPPNPITPDIECLWECSYPDYTSGECTDGLMDILAEAIFADNKHCAPGFGGDDVGCVDQDTTIMCGAPELSMPFFGIGQFMMSIVAIIGAYILIGMKRRY